MKNLDLTQILSNFNQEIKNLESVVLVQQRGNEITKKISGLFHATQAVFGPDIDLILMNKGVDTFLSNSLHVIESQFDIIDSHLIDYAGNQIVIHSKKVPYVNPLKPLPGIIENDLKINKQDINYYLIMSYLSQNDIFETIQLALSLKELKLKK